MNARDNTLLNQKAPGGRSPRGKEPRLRDVNDLQRTYTGLLDDVMLAYSADFRGERFFNKMIAKNILFGGGIYLNDGYLVNHPVARRHLANDDSLMRVMITTNFIRVLSRKNDPDSLSRMPQDMADSGNGSFVRLVRSTEWKRVRPYYERVVNGIFHNNNVRSWPAFDMSHGFAKLVERAFEAPPANVGLRTIDQSTWFRIRDEFSRASPREGNARHKFEVALKSVVGDRNMPALKEAMSIANQAYHYNIGMMLTHDPAEAANVAVDTTVGPAFDELLQTRELLRGQLDGMKLISIPAELPLHNGDVFLPFLDPNSRVAQAKFEYLASLRQLLEPDPTDLVTVKKQVQDATRRYIDRMQKLFAAKFGRSATRDVFREQSIGFAIGSIVRHGRSSADSAVIATAAPTMGLAITLQAQAMNATRHFLVERFRLRADDPQGDHADSSIRLAEIRPHVSSLAFNPAASLAHVADLPVFGG